MPDLETDVIEQVRLLVKAVPGMVTTFDYHPLVVSADELPAAVVWVERVREERHGLGGMSGGRKHVFYSVVVEVRADTFTPETATKEWYALVNAVRKTLRTHQTLDGLVERFGEDIEVAFDEPSVTADTTHFAAKLTSEAKEDVTA